MGLTSWRKAPIGKIYSSDVAIAKNYLEKDEVDHLNRIVVMYLDYAELQAAKNREMKMADWIVRLDGFLRFSEYDILTDAGNISHEVAKSLAMQQYDNFKVKQDRDYVSDFDKEVKKLKSVPSEDGQVK